MKERGFSIGEAVKYGWEATLRNWKVLVPVVIIYGLINSIVSRILQPAGQIPTNTIYQLVSFLINSLLAIGLITIALKIYDGKKAEVVDLFTNTKPYLNYVGGTVLFVLIVVLGFIALIVPGIYLALKYQFYSYLIVEKGLKPVEALRQSSKMTEGIKIDLLVFDFALVGIIILGAMALLAGLLVAVPITFMAGVYVYRKLSQSISSPGTIEKPLPA